MPVRPYHAGDYSRVAEAIVILRQARDLLKAAGARKAAERVQRALSSGYGARRHVRTRRFRAQYPQIL